MNLPWKKGERERALETLIAALNKKLERLDVMEVELESQSATSVAIATRLRDLAGLVDRLAIRQDGLANKVDRLTKEGLTGFVQQQVARIENLEQAFKHAPVIKDLHDAADRAEKALAAIKGEIGVGPFTDALAAVRSLKEHMAQAKGLDTSLGRKVQELNERLVFEDPESLKRRMDKLEASLRKAADALDVF